MGAPMFSLSVNRLLGACFVTALAIPLGATLAGVDRTPALEENRERAAWPGTPASRAEWAAWPEALTRWFTDHVAFRTDLIRTQARVRVEALHSSAGRAGSTTPMTGALRKSARTGRFQMRNWKPGAPR